MMKRVYFVFGFLFVLIFSGCTNKNILMPGQEYSDCYVANDNNGVCGNPMYLYKYKYKIQSLPPHPGITYTIDEKGVIREKDSGKIIHIADNYSSKDSVKNKDLLVKNRSLVIKSHDDIVPIRDVGYVRKVWVAPYSDIHGNLIDAHNIYIVVKKPKWIIGEETPQRTHSGAIVPSLLTTKIVEDRQHNPVYKDIKKVQKYIKENKKDKEMKKYEKNILNYIKGKE